MSKSIWKFELKVQDFEEIEMPATAEILSLQVQNGKPCIWALVDPTARKETRTFATYGTGHPIVTNEGISHTFIGTYQLPSNGLVFHVFETDI